MLRTLMQYCRTLSKQVIIYMCVQAKTSLYRFAPCHLRHCSSGISCHSSFLTPLLSVISLLTSWLSVSCLMKSHLDVILLLTSLLSVILVLTSLLIFSSLAAALLGTVSCLLEPFLNASFFSSQWHWHLSSDISSHCLLTSYACLFSCSLHGSLFF